MTHLRSAPCKHYPGGGTFATWNGVCYQCHREQQARIDAESSKIEAHVVNFDFGTGCTEHGVQSCRVCGNQALSDWMPAAESGAFFGIDRSVLTRFERVDAEHYAEMYDADSGDA